MGRIKNVLRHLNDAMQSNAINAANQLVVVGFISFAGFPLFYFFWTYWFPHAYSNLKLHLVGSLLGLGLICTPYWPLKYKKYLSWYWFLTIVFSLPFFFTFLFLRNQASVISAMFLLCGVFFLVWLIDLLTLTIALVLGFSLALIGYYFSAPHFYFSEEHVEMALIIMFITITGSTLNYKSAVLQRQKLAGMAAAAGMIAHELRTPLLGIKSGAQALVQYLPKLTQGYQLATERELIEKPLRNNRLQQLTAVSDRIVNEINYANIIIDMLLVKAGYENSSQHNSLEMCTIEECVTEALARYPFQYPGERALITWTGDFQFKGSKLLMQHVLFNLIKNALYVIATAQRGEITIWTSLSEKMNYLYFKDTAKGMNNQQLSQLFNHFYTTNSLGTGIGLSFCKLVMHGFGGNIVCESIEGEYALFILSFPVERERVR